MVLANDGTGMLPYLKIGQIKISTYYAAMILGYVLMVILMLLKERRENLDISKLKSVIFATSGLLCGVLGCKILFILENFAYVQNKGLSFGGFSFYGSVFLTPFIMPLVGKALGFKLRDSFDNSAICIVAMLGMIRVGCFLNGCCGGKLINIGDFYFTFPIQLIECICDFLILHSFLNWEKRKIANGFFIQDFFSCMAVQDL
ncbi:MAG: prolipoprotein diacylglyceryl transferase [Clostridia bacterium]|nr:prolipoprotein diacylglyceryl transferase [Clostridia bacterium]